MNTDPAIHGSPVIEKFTRMGALTLGHIAAVCVAVILVLAWIITAPIFHLSDVCRGKSGAKMKVKKI
jgi:hypothetical protein